MLYEMLYEFIGVIIGIALLCFWAGRRSSPKKEKAASKKAGPAAKARDGFPVDLMPCQLAAMYIQDEQEKTKEKTRKAYIRRMAAMGVPKNDAGALFEFECDVLRRYPRPFMADPRYTRCWMFDMQQKHFRDYPREKADILKEKSLTLGALCKIIDEAEWHFWNSRGSALDAEVWGEVAAWRLKGPGGDFAVEYCEAVSQQTGVPMSSMQAVINGYGALLSKYRWG